MQTIPQTMQAIRTNVAQTVTDLVGAQNAVRALMERPALPMPQAEAVGDTLPQMLATVQTEFSATLGAFAELAQYVHGWTTANLTPPADDGEPIPQPIVAPTLAGGLNKPIAITVPTEPTTTTVPTDDTPEDRPEDPTTQKPGSDDDEAAILAQNDANFDKAIDDEVARVNRIAAHLSNGHVPQGEELTALGVGTETPEAGKRGGRGRRKSK